MKKVIENYVLDNVIGSGQYGKVFKAVHNVTNEVVAIKVVKLEKMKEVQKLYEFTMNEIQILSRIENPNIIRFLEMLKSQNNMYLVYEFCNGGTLEEAIKAKKFLDEKRSIEVFLQLLNAFKTLVKLNILHRDLKPSNILFHNNVIKVADFGFCKALKASNDLTKTMVGSPIYMAPEILKGFNYSIKADIWSLGVVLFECLFGYCPFEERTIARLISLIDQQPFKIPTNINKTSPFIEGILKKILVVDFKKRISWEDLFKQFYPDENEPAPSMNRNSGNSSFQIASGSHTQPSTSENTPMHSQANHNDRITRGVKNAFVNVRNVSRERVNSLQKGKNSDQNFPQNLSSPIISAKNKLERKKVISLAHCLKHILELNIHEELTPMLSFLIMKLIRQLNSSIEDYGTKYEKAFHEERELIYSTFPIFQEEILRFSKSHPKLAENYKFLDQIREGSLDISFLVETFILYLEELRIISSSLSPSNKPDLNAKTYIDHGKKIFDSLLFWLGKQLEGLNVLKDRNRIDEQNADHFNEKIIYLKNLVF